MIKLKDILYETLTEARNRKHGSGELEYNLETDGLHIPGICVPTDILRIDITIDYNYTGGTPDRGMFGSMADAEPGEGPEIEILGHVVTQILVSNAANKEREIYYQYLVPQQQELVDVAIDKLVNKKRVEIEEMIINQEEQ